MPRPTSDLPELRGLPLLGCSIQFARDPLGFVTRSLTAGDLVRVRIGPGTMCFVHHPEQIEQVLVGLKDQTRKDRVTRRLSLILGNGLLTSEGAEWLRHRRIAAPSFQPKQIGGYADTMVASTARFLSSLPAEGERDLRPDMMRLTLDIVVRTLFDPSMHGRVDSVQELIDVLIESATNEAQGIDSLLPIWVPTPSRARIQRTRKSIDEMFYAVIRARRAATEQGDDLLSRLLAARDEDGQGFSDEQLRDELVTIFIAGHETTAIVLTFALYLLAAHPAEQGALYEEVQGALGDRPATGADIARLPRTAAVVNEVMRLYPPAWIIGREALSDVEVGGYTIPAGHELTLLQWVVHRDPRWWREPAAFRPDRWQNGETDGNPRFAYFPFGGGPRVCVGNHFAKMEAVLALATLVQGLEVSLRPGFQPTLVPSITLRPKEMPLRFRRRAGGGAPVAWGPPHTT